MTTIDKKPDIQPGLVALLWQFIEDGGDTEQFFALRDMVRSHGALYDTAPDMLAALEQQEMADADPATARRKGYYDLARSMRKAAIAKAGGRQ
jgi:hypothetical protein